MATPPYIGSGQPQVGKSMWSGLTSWFGGSAPAYKPAPAPSSTSATKATTASASTTTDTDTDDASASSAQPTRVIVIVPHGGFIPAVEWPDSQQ